MKVPQSSLIVPSWALLLAMILACSNEEMLHTASPAATDTSIVEATGTVKSPPVSTPLRPQLDDPVPRAIVERDLASAAKHPDVASVFIGFVAERLRNETKPPSENTAGAIYGIWRIDIDEYVIRPLPHQYVTVRIREFSLVPEKVQSYTDTTPFTGQRAVFIVSKNCSFDYAVAAHHYCLAAQHIHNPGPIVVQGDLVQVHKDSILVEESVDQFVERITAD